MGSQPIEPASSSETRKDLQAAVEARRELGPEMEDQVLEAFLARIEGRVQAQIAEQRATAKPIRKRGKYNPTEIVGTTFGVAVPLMIIAAIFAGAVGVVAVVALVVVVNLLYILDNRT